MNFGQGASVLDPPTDHPRVFEMVHLEFRLD
jgi:hypothetical protein